MKTSSNVHFVLNGIVLCGLALSGPAYASDETRKQETAQKQLEDIEVTAPRVRRAETDGTGSYTTPAVTVAGKVPLPLKEIPNSVSVITRQQMDDQNMVTVEDALKQATGVTVISNDPSQSQYHARGYALEVQNDGMPAYNALSGYQQFDLDIYDRIEVLRGPAGLLQGSGEPSGTVNLVKKTPRNEFAASGTASAGSWDNYRASLDVTGPLTPNRALRGRMVLSGQHRGFYFDRAHDSRWLTYGVLEYDLTPSTTASVSVTYQDDNSPSFSGLPAYSNGKFLNVSRSTNVYPDWAKNLWTTLEVGAKLEHHFQNDWITSAKFSRRDQDLFFKDAYPATGVDPATMTAAYARRQADYNYERYAADIFASGPFKLFGQTHNLLLGFNYDRSETTYKRGNASKLTGVDPFNLGSDISTEPTVTYSRGGESKTLQYGYYGQVRYKLLTPLTLVFGGRFTNFDSKSRNTPPSTATDWSSDGKENSHFTMSGGLVYDLTRETALYFSYSDIFAPQSDLKYNGNALDPRTGRQYEVGVKGEHYQGKLNTALALFLIRDEGRAYSDPDHPDYYLNAGKAESKGIEAEIAGRPLNGWDISAGYTFLETKYLKDDSSQGKPLSNWYPKHSFKLWNTYHFSAGLLDGFSLGGGVNVYGSSKQNNSATTAALNVRKQDAYAVVNLQAGYKVNKHLTATLSVNNLFDEKYYTRIGGLNTYNYYGEPRNLMFTMRATY
jgi:outer membrane receptor for ferric coprogen and ferric-rhodotorulic acid